MQTAANAKMQQKERWGFDLNGLNRHDAYYRYAIRGENAIDVDLKECHKKQLADLETCADQSLVFMGLKKFPGYNINESNAHKEKQFRDASPQWRGYRELRVAILMGKCFCNIHSQTQELILDFVNLKIDHAHWQEPAHDVGKHGNEKHDNRKSCVFCIHACKNASIKTSEVGAKHVASAKLKMTCCVCVWKLNMASHLEISNVMMRQSVKRIVSKARLMTPSLQYGFKKHLAQKSGTHE
jgi:hypothetical protein